MEIAVADEDAVADEEGPEAGPEREPGLAVESRDED